MSKLHTRLVQSWGEHTADGITRALRNTAWQDEPEWSDPLDDITSTTDAMFAEYDTNRWPYVG
jgi:hypothetical protein